MDEKIQQLWNKNKLYFFLLIIPISIWVFKDILMSLLVSRANKELAAAQKKDEGLSADIAATKAKAEMLEETAKSLDEKAKKIKGDPDWNEKGSARIVSVVLVGAVLLVYAEMLSRGISYWGPPIYKNHCFVLNKYGKAYNGVVIENNLFSKKSKVMLRKKEDSSYSNVQLSFDELKTATEVPCE
jgi:cell division protein FtsB